MLFQVEPSFEKQRPLELYGHARLFFYILFFYLYLFCILRSQPGQVGTKNICHQSTKDFILLFFLSVLVPLWREEKVLPQNVQNPQLRY